METKNKKILNCLVVDDEPFSIEIIKNYIEKVPGLFFKAKCGNAIDALRFIREHSVDLVFLDINMPEVTGIQMVKSMTDPPLIVFVTAYPEYAIKGFDLDAVDYLLKPFGFDRFMKAVEKVYSRIGAELLSEDMSEGFIMVRADKRDYKLKLADIIFIQSKGDYLKIVASERSYLIHETMQNIMEILPENKFVRIHKSYIVYVPKIKYLEGNQLFLETNAIPIGKVYRDGLLKVLSGENL